MNLYPALPFCQRARDRFVLREGKGVELEVGAFLFALVRLTKPDLCVETGAFIGDSAEWIGRALAENGHGHLHTCDINPDIVPSTASRLSGLPVTVHKKYGADLIAELTSGGAMIDFAHVDSGSQQERKQELLMLDESKISPLGIVAFHDACVGYSELYPAMAEARKDWPHLVIPSIVGIAAFQRPQ